MSRWLLALLLCGAAGAVAEPPPYHVMMLLYRGCEEACQGFQDHFGRQQVPARFTLRDANQDPRRIPGFVAEARRLRPDLVVAWGTTVALESVGQWDAVDRSRHIVDIPVVFMAVSDPLQSRLVPTLAGSGRNLAGTLYLLPIAEQLRAARAYLDFRRMGFLYNPAEANSLNSLQDLRAQASHFGFSVVVETLPIGANGQPSAADIPGRIGALAAAGVDLLYFSPDSFLNSQRRLVTGEALARRMPVLAAAEAPVTQADALLGVLNRYDRIGRFTARLALRILLEGVPPGELPIELPRQFSYLINLRVAHRLGRYPPLPLLDIAEIVGSPVCPATKGNVCD